MESIRRRLFRSLPDLGATAFLSIAIPIIYWFEMFIVLPSIPFLSTPIVYYGHLLLGSVLMFQIVGNWLSVMMTGTSTKGLLMPIPRKEDVDMESPHKWRFCAKCEAFQPPRSWHCRKCDVCILKRDHHCLFTSTCIGHRNQRQFLLLVGYLCLATTYATFYNHYFIWVLHGNEFKSWWTLLKVVFPLAWFMFEMTITQFYFMVYMVTLVGSLFTGALFLVHAENAMKGRIMFEMKKDCKVDYSQGWKMNLKMVFGHRWLVTLINPFAHSELPHDGIHWMELAKHKSN